MVVAGDFNQSYPYAHRFGTKEGADALDRAVKEVGLQCVTEGTTDESTDHPRIDHICTGLHASHTAVFPQPRTWKMPILGGRPVSDHGGAFVDLESSWFNPES